jgi:hypothetical protein
MATFNQSLTRLRRFLRDPEALIWEDEDIRIYWNDAQLEIASKVGFIERINAYRYPPLYNWSYGWDWEIQHIDGDMYQYLNNWPARDVIISYPWEAGYFLTSMSTVDDGTRFMHPWESAYCSPADVVRIPLHFKFNKMKFAAFDEDKIEPITEKELAMNDSWYKTKSGEVLNYYRPDEYENDIVLYPRPSSITWDDSALLLTDSSESFADVAGDGIVNYVEDGFDESDTGIIFDTTTVEGHLLCIFEALPDGIDDDEETWDDPISWWPIYMIPMIEYATLERCLGADTDGFIPSLRDYWLLRKNIGIETIKTFKGKRLTDRDYRLGGDRKTWRVAHARLPDKYPRTWP